jgi:hypothetical protein
MLIVSGTGHSIHAKAREFQLASAELRVLFSITEMGGVSDTSAPRV